MGREYSHWIDLRLIKLMDAVISKIYLTKLPCLSKRTFLGSNKRVNKRYKNVQRPQNQCFGSKQKRRGWVNSEGGGQIMKVVGKS